MHELPGRVHRRQYACWRELVSGSAGSKMSRRFRTTEHGDPVDAEEDVSKLFFSGNGLELNNP